MPVGRAGVSPLVRKVRTESGTTAVQIVSKSGVVLDCGAPGLNPR